MGKRPLQACDKGLEMAQTAEITAIVVAALSLLVAAGGAWAWWHDESPAWLWRTWRAAQLSTTLLAAVAVIALVSGFDPPDNLFWLYLLLPIAVSIIAEQLRIASAQTVLDQHDLENAQAVGLLPEDRQAEIVAAIVARETWIVALAALVIAFLAVRVLMTA
jgi:hypothetical protein